MILGQESRKRIKEDKERRKVGIGRLGEEEEDFEILVFKKILRTRILEEKFSQRVGILIIALCGSSLEGEHWAPGGGYAEIWIKHCRDSSIT